MRVRYLATHSSVKTYENYMICGEDAGHPTDTENIGEEPDRWLLLDPDRAANMLEVVVLVTAEGDQLAIHAMRMRPIYERLPHP